MRDIAMRRLSGASAWFYHVCAGHKFANIFIYNRRIMRKTDRRDFLTRMIEDRDPKVVTDRQIAAHASDLVIGGSDTTATGLSCIVYHILKSPSIKHRLTVEVRSAFESYADITYLSTASLPYLRAVILEGLRIYPPAPFGPPRVVPEGGDTVDGHFLPQGVSNIALNGSSPSWIQVANYLWPA